MATNITLHQKVRIRSAVVQFAKLPYSFAKMLVLLNSIKNMEAENKSQFFSINYSEKYV
jgi:hypothetical protein